MDRPAPVKPAPPPVSASRPLGAKPPAKRTGIRPGVNVSHPKYGRGIVLRKEGDGEDAKLTVSFPGDGLKKLLAKFAGLTEE